MFLVYVFVGYNSIQLAQGDISRGGIRELVSCRDGDDLFRDIIVLLSFVRVFDVSFLDRYVDELTQCFNFLKFHKKNAFYEKNSVESNYSNEWCYFLLCHLYEYYRNIII